MEEYFRIILHCKNGTWLRDIWPQNHVIITRLTRRAGLRRSRHWYELKRDTGLSPGRQGKNGTFSEKKRQKGSQNGVRRDYSCRYDFSFFASFSGVPENPSWINTSGKRGCSWCNMTLYPQKSLKIRTDVQAYTSRLKPWVAEKESPSAQLKIIKRLNP